ncbi:hypothetical protein F5I97DRAFT_604980 [Phlebopus sp. FC_14]|nr:hypothetical protein F5I97DRAFT_604980 [Phlebopus sp. FC_14]
MSNKSRKRRRSQAFPAADDEQNAGKVLDEEQINEGNTQQSQTDESEELTEEQKRELEVWDAFKEEHHEVLEQLPLSLHRQFTLLRELDTQNEDLLSSVQRYVDLRCRVQSFPEASSPRPPCMSAAQAPSSADTGHLTEPVPECTHMGGTDRTSLLPAIKQDGALVDQELRESTRILLQHIAETSEGSLRLAEEKVSLAQTAYETVDRHIRQLDQVIKDQEAAISLGMRPGTHLAPILLPDLVVPRWARPPRVEHSPVPSLISDPGIQTVDEPAVHEVPQPVAFPKAPKKGRKLVLKTTTPAPEVQLSEEPATRRGVRLTIPTHPPGPQVPADPKEARYCYCNQVSFGTMIACDNENCKLEWFHLGCTGLPDVPNKKAKWYCRDCKPKMGQKGRQRT